ncbi:hypothetical protein Tco_0748276 [Tanacetum coccineum]|uniref:Uncharacterized protein n=1 Tax=Tanacetum coccineum TaxID=301880 RepID=A0ABQ4YVC2_9ASTR
MGDANPIRTLGYYSRPSHEGYRNTIELPKGNNVVLLRSDNIRLVQNGCSFYGLRIDLWLQVQIFYDRINEALKKTIDYAAKGRLKKLSAEKAWATIEKLAQYEDKRWSDPVITEEGSLDYKNPDIEQLLGVMENKVDALMKNAISLMIRSEGVFRMTSSELYQLPPEPSRQEEFEHIVMNFILDREKRVKQLDEYMKIIISNFMQLSSEVTRRLKKFKMRGAE